MRERLGRKGFGSSTVEALIEELKRKGLLDDEKFARYFATAKSLSKPVGRRLLLRELIQKGIPPALADRATEEATSETDELETVRELASQRLSHMKGLPTQAVQRRLFGFLSRRGFSAEVVYRVVRELA